MNADQDRHAAILTMIGEAGDQGDAGLAGVGNVLLNRAQLGSAGGYADTPGAVGVQPGQFEAWNRKGRSLMALSPADPAYQRAAQIFDGLTSGQIGDNTKGATNFYAPAAQAALGRSAPSWGSKNITAQIGGHVFSAPKGAVVRQQQSQSSDGVDVDGLASMWTGGGSTSSSTTPAAASPESAARGQNTGHGGDVDVDGLASMWGGSKLDGDAPAGDHVLTVTRGPYGSLAGVDPSRMSAAQGDATNLPASKAGDAGMAAGRGAIAGLPIVGPYIASGLDHAIAAERAVHEDVPYSQTLQEVQAFGKATEAAHPIASTAGAVGANVAGFGLAGATEAGATALGLRGGNMLMRAGLGATTSGAIDGGDAYVRSGGDEDAAKTGAALGITFGALGPTVGGLAGAGGNALGHLIEGYRPEAAATNRLLAAVQGTGGDLPTMAQRLADNPRLSLMDVNPGVQDLAQGLAAQPGRARDTLVQAYGQRAGSAKDAVTGAYADLGASPDVKATLDGIRARANADAALTPASMREAFDASMGDAKNPKAMLDQIIEQRSQQSAPLYQEALSKPVVWDNRLQQFLDDPVVQQGLSKGARIQRLESLASGEKFNPTDYAIKDFDAAGDPIIGTTPNMRTLNVVKKGLDAMVEDSKDAVTGRLSEEGRAVDQVRKAFVAKLDQTNPTYAEARAAWQGPTLAHQAFQKGLSVFGNRGGMAGVDTTPGALADWVAKASPAERDAIKVGARAAAEQAMATAPDAGQAATRLIGNDANRAKLVSILGKDEASSLINRLSYQYGDPVGDAFKKGADVFRNRGGSAGLEDRPEFLKSWLDTASGPEKEALQHGVMASLEQQLGGVRNAALKGETIPQVDFNRQKLALVFGKDKADQLARRMADEKDMVVTNAKLFQGSQTQPRQAKLATSIRDVGPMSMEIGLPSFAAMTGNPMTAAGLAGAALARRGLQVVGRTADRSRNALMADAATATGPAAQDQVNRLLAVAQRQGLPAAATGTGNALGAAFQSLPIDAGRLQGRPVTSRQITNRLLRSGNGR